MEHRKFCRRSGITRPAVLAALVIAAFACIAAVPVRAQITDSNLAAARKKLDAYTALYGATHNMQASWLRYIERVTASGTTGRESRIVGILVPPAATPQLAAAEALLTASPKLAEADRAAKALVAFYREAVPVMTEAAKFFDQYVPKSDQGRAGHVMHRNLASKVPFAVDARADLYRAIDATRGEIETLEFARLSKGANNARWHVAAAGVAARKVRTSLPVSAGPFDPAALERAISAFDAVARESEAFDKANPGQLLMFSSSPRTFHKAAMRLKQQIAGRGNPREVTAADIRTLDFAYQQLNTMTDAYRMNNP